MVFKRPHGNPKLCNVPCGRCVGCRLERSKQWAIRIMHEAQMHKANSFITLTYENTDADTHALIARAPTSLIKQDVQRFMKRLRKNNEKHYRVDSVGSEQPPSPLGDGRIKFYAIGEYGPATARPHYHAAIFGEDFHDDRYPWKKSKAGNQLWRSPRLEKIWTQGNCDIGELTLESAAYMARYIMAKINGDMAIEHYKRTDPTTGTDFWIQPEFNLMSRGGRNGKGIGASWFEKFQTDVYPHDYVVHKDKKMKPPRYYDALMAKIDQHLVDQIKLERERKGALQAGDNTPERLAVKETVALARLNLNQRQ